MGEAANSWLRRANFSHTVCHRLDLTRSNSIPEAILRDAIFALSATRASSDSVFKNPVSPNSRQINRTPSKVKHRSSSPLPATVLPDSFKEAQFHRKRFSSPYNQRNGKETEKCMSGMFVPRSSGSDCSLTDASDAYKKMRSRKELPSAKYSDHGDGRVTAVDGEITADLSKLFLGLRFAHGVHSRLYHGVYKDEPVAVKILRVPDDDENGTMSSRLEKQFNREVSILSSLQHQHVIKFVAACRDPPVFCIITEYLVEGSLRAYLHKLRHKSLPLEKIIAIALDVARGMEHLHSNGVIHRDIKPENILISQDFKMKIADFGIACEEICIDSLADDQGTFRWMAPEMIKHKSYGRKVDVYSFGLILWEMVAGTIPYVDLTPFQAAFAVVNKNLRPVIPEECQPAMRALIEQCWASQVAKRPEFSQVVIVLERFKSVLEQGGRLDDVDSLMCQDDQHKKGILQWAHKLHSNGAYSLQKPKFL